MYRTLLLSTSLFLLFFSTLWAGEIHVTGQGLSILDGDTRPRTADGTDFGQLAAGGGTRTYTFVIRNTSGSSALFVAAVSENGAAFSLIGAPSGASIAAGQTRSFEIRFNPTSAGVKTATVTIVNDDSNENPYTFSITGEGLGTPEIDLRGSQNGSGPWVTILDGDTNPMVSDGTDFGDADVGGTSISKTFQIVNTGDGQLTIDSITEGNTNFSISSVPATVGVNQTQTFTATFDPQSAGTKTTTVTIQNNDANEDPYTFSLTGVGRAPDLNVRGQGLLITNGDSTPRSSDGTNFGQVAAGGGSISKTFVIHNDGNTELNVSSVLENSNAFSISGAPTGAVPIPAGGSDSFTVTFDPVSAGVRTTTLQIRSDDSAADPYTFDITGEGLGTPEILVQGQSNGTWIEILDGDPTPGTQDGTDFSNATVGGSGKTRSFRIRNTGNAQLVIDSITENSPHFSVADAPATVGVNQTNTFSITFAPNSSGTKNATITIENNDPNEDPYTFNLTGVGRAPDIEVRGQGLLITNGDVTPRPQDGTNFGQITAAAGMITKTFVIHNEGNTDLTVSAVLENGAAFSISGAPTSAVPIPAGSTANFDIIFDPVSAGTKTATVQIRSDDASSDPYTFDIIGEGLGSSEIVVRGRLNAASPWSTILDGDPSPNPLDGTDFGEVALADPALTHTFEIGNTGASQLTITSITVDSPHFSVSGVPNAVGVNQTKTFSLTFAPLGRGERTATVTIRNNDPDEDPFTFEISGTGKAPDLVARGQGIEIPNGDTTPRTADGTDFGQVAAGGGSVTRSFVIYNEGNEDLTVNSVLEDGAAFTLSGVPGAAFPIPAGSSNSFDVTFDPNSGGIKSATVQIRSSDPTKDPYTFEITGEGLGTPELVVSGRPLSSQPWVMIQNGAANPSTSNGSSFGLVHVADETATHEFQLANVGFAQITIDSIVSDSPEFIVSNVPNVVGVNQEQTFSITFNPAPGSLDELTALITIRSNDPDDDPFTFTVIGTAVAPFLKLDGISRGHIFGDLDPPEEEDNRIKGLNDLLSRAGRFTTCALEQLNPFDHDNSCWDSGTLFGLPPLSPGDPRYFSCIDDSEDIWIEAGDTTPEFADFTDLGIQVVGGYNLNTFEITNTGNTTLTLLGLSVSNSDFRVRSYQLPVPIPPGKCTPIEVILASYGGDTSAVVSIVTDDPVNPLFTFAVRGYGLTGSPNIIVEGQDIATANGRRQLYNTSFASISGPSTDPFEDVGLVGQNDIRTYWISNTGDAPLFILDISSDNPIFTVISDIVRVNPGETEAFQIEFDPNSLGSHSGTIIIDHNDTNLFNDGDFDFHVEGRGVTASTAKPRIGIRSALPDLHPISNGQTPHFYDGTRIGTIDVGESVSRTFRVENTGDAPLNISDAVLLGAPNALTGMATTIPPGGFDEFTVTITPSVAGRQFRPVMIGSDDPDHPVYLFWLTALAIEDPGPTGELRITTIARSGDDILLSFLAPTGSTYRVQTNTDLSPAWTDVPSLTNLPGSTSEQQVNVPDGATSDRRFFRVKKE